MTTVSKYSSFKDESKEVPSNIVKIFEEWELPWRKGRKKGGVIPPPAPRRSSLPGPLNPYLGGVDEWDPYQSLAKKGKKKKKEEPEEPKEPEVVHNLDDLPVQEGDYVVCEDTEGLSQKQLDFLNSKPYLKVKSVCDKKGNWYRSGEPYIEVGYNIPLKLFRFKKIDRAANSKYKILFLQFNIGIDLHGEEDTHNYFKGHESMPELFTDLFKEKLPEAFVEFATYDDLYRVGGDFYMDDIKLKDFNFVFFGFMSKFTPIVSMLISYLDNNKVPYLKYGTYKHLDNKAYEMHLVESLGYPYIPTIMTSRLTRKIVEHVKEFGFPVIVKDIDLNRGEGVWKVEDMEELKSKFAGNSKPMLIQKFVPNDGDYRVISIKNKVELVIKKQRIEGSKEFRANVARGGKAVKGTLPPEIISMCEDISKHLICDIVGFDVIQDIETKKYYIMETNSSPHFPTFSVISEIDIPSLLINYIIENMKKD